MVFLALMSLFFCSVTALSPSPVRCDTEGCTVWNYQGLWPDRKACKVATVFYPRTEEDLVHAVAEGVRLNKTIKVVSKWSQTVTKFVCPEGGLLISTEDLNREIGVNAKEKTVTVDAGVLLRDLLDRISAQDFALPAATYWDAVSVAGAISTGAHGSSLWGRGGALHDHVVGMSLVVPASEREGFAKVLRISQLKEHEDLLNAAKVSLGVLGAISKVIFIIEPLFKRSVKLEVVSDDGIEDEILRWGSKHEFGDMCWHPSLRKTLMKMDGRVSADIPGDGTNKYRGFQASNKFAVEQLRQAGSKFYLPIKYVTNFSAAEEKMEAERDEEGACKLADSIVNSRVPSGNGYLNDGLKFTHFPVVGWNNEMQTAGGCQKISSSVPSVTATRVVTSDCSSGAAMANSDEIVAADDAEICSWDPRVNGSLFYQSAVSVPLAKARELIVDIKKLRDMKPKSMCGLSIYGGIYIRYVKGSSAFLGQIEDSVEFDFTYMRSRKWGVPRMNEDVYEEIEQMTWFKYKGKPHWGKNRNIAFTTATKDLLKSRVRDLDKFMKVKKELDPMSVFSTQWSQTALGDGNSKKNEDEDEDGCAIEGLCICSDDRHCAVDKGYLCRPGKVFKDARVCERV